MLAGSIFTRHYNHHLHVGRVTVFSLGYVSILCLLLPIFTSYPLTLILNSLIGLVIPAMNALLLGFVSTQAPDTMQGRLTTTMSVPAQALSSLCGAMAGPLLAHTSYSCTLLLFALPAMTGAVLCGLSKDIRRIHLSSRSTRCANQVRIVRTQKAIAPQAYALSPR
ncbi:MFS transporter [Alloscardovia criceti]|uniref:hypothetical protein n=1 Tax=Alloscardovia criceti TaxID=356828 RepID=UPI003898FF6D